MIEFEPFERADKIECNIFKNKNFSKTSFLILLKILRTPFVDLSIINFKRIYPPFCFFFFYHRSQIVIIWAMHIQYTYEIKNKFNRTWYILITFTIFRSLMRRVRVTSKVTLNIFVYRERFMIVFIRKK